MKICIIFRGENERNYVEYVNSLQNINNWKTYIFSDLDKNNYQYDTVFITYKTDILGELIEQIKPKHTILCEKENSSQITNLKMVNDFIQTNKEFYDRFIIFRFDIIYKTPITTWNYWNSTGITVPGKDSTWHETKFCNDILFIIDKEFTHYFDDGCKYMLSIDSMPIEKRIDKYSPMGHHIGQYFYYNNITNIYYMFGIENGTNHPHYIFVRNDLKSIYL